MILNRAHQLLHQYATSHPGMSSLLMIGGSTVFGVALLNIIDCGSDPYKCDPKKKISTEQARIIAMVKDAKESTWRENLEKVAVSQDNFMAAGRKSDSSKFMIRIDQRSMEILKKQHEKIDREMELDDTTMQFWK